MELDCKLDRSLVVTELCLTLYSSGCACFKTRQWSMGFWTFSSILLICVTRFILTVSKSVQTLVVLTTTAAIKAVPFDTKQAHSST